VVTVSHIIQLSKVDDANGANTTVFFSVIKNGVTVLTRTGNTNETFTLSYQPGDTIEYQLESDSQTGPGQGSSSGSVSMSINQVAFQSGSGQVTNLPYNISVNTSVSA